VIRRTRCSKILRVSDASRMSIMPTVPPEYVKIVAFLCTEDKNNEGAVEIVPKATAFFVRVAIGEPCGNAKMEYIITARHVIEEARAAAGTLYLRMNKLDGVLNVAIAIDDWREHDSADVAALLMSPTDLPDGITSNDLDQAGITLSSALDDTYRYAGSTDLGDVDVTIGLGADMYLTGLFSDPNVEPGYVPIVRFGHVSRMPSQIKIESGKTHTNVLAYLMEFQSWGGHSGSPVFFLHPIVVETERADGTKFDTGWITGLAGLVSGHFGIAEKQEQASGEIFRYQMNSGIAIVTPSHSITQLLFRKDIVEDRLAKAKTIVERHTSTV
jgi:hypothetical protein